DDTMWDRDFITPFDQVYQVALLLLIGFGIVALGIAIVYERRMQGHRQPGVSYRDVTFRRDGAWRRADPFTETGLSLQRRAATWGMIGAACLVVAVGMIALGRILPSAIIPT